MVKIEEGKFYKTMDGRKASVSDFCHSVCNVEIDNKMVGYVFIENGMADIDPKGGEGIEFEYDLIEEWTDEPKSPIETKLVKKLVPGVYGKLKVEPHEYHSALIGLDDNKMIVYKAFTANELRAAAKTFIEIADYLDEQ